MIKKNDSIAIALLDQAISSDPIRAAFYNNRGWVHQLQANYDLAKKDFDAAVRFDSTNVRYWHNPIRILLIQKNVPKGLELCNNAILKFPEDGYAYFVRSSLLREFVKNEKLANSDLKKAHELGWAKGFYFVY